MNVGLYLIFALAAVILGSLIFFVWRLWEDHVSKSPADEVLERDLVSLNDAQANRVSDTQLTRPVEPDDAWRTMVERGQRPAPPKRKRRKGPDTRR